MNRQEALIQTLHLAITAPTEEQADRATDLAERIAADLKPIQVERAKQRAIKYAERD